MLIQSIQLKKDIAGFKAGDVINASTTAIAAHGLKLSDYSPLGTHMNPTPSDLPEVPASAQPATKKK